jgi:predicted nucleotidyltransferase
VDIDTIKAKLTPLLERSDAEKAILFGSYARSTQDDRSDIDLIIIDNEDLPYLRRLDKYFADIVRTLEKSVDLFVYNNLEFEDMKEGFFIGRAVAEGVVLYERGET